MMEGNVVFVDFDESAVKQPAKARTSQAEKPAEEDELEQTVREQRDKLQKDSDALPEGFAMISDAGSQTPDGIYFKEPKRNKDGDINKDDDGNIVYKLVYVCSQLLPLGQSRDEDDRGWSVVVEFPDTTGSMHRLSIAMADLEGDAKKVRSELADAGLRIAQTDAGKRYLARLLATGGKKVLRSFRRPGWHGDVFAAPSGLIIPQTQELCELAQNARLDKPDPKGSFEGWLDAVTAAVKAGNDHWCIGAAAGFAGVIQQLAGYRTVALNFSGPSSFGKTTAQALAASAWGNPEAGAGLLYSMKNTPNAVELLALGATGTVLALDEMALMDPRDIGPLVFSLASGVTKNRLTKELGLRRPLRWTTLVLMSSERTLGSIIRSTGRAMLGGHAVRCVDVDCSVGKKVNSATLAKIERVKEHYGHSGRRFVEHLFSRDYVRDRDALRDRIERAIDEIAGKDAQPTERRAATVFALIQVAGEIAKEAKILPADLAIAAVVKREWSRYTTNDEGDVTIDQAERGISAFRSWVVSQLGQAIQPAGLNARSFRGTVAWYQLYEHTDEGMLYVLADQVVEIVGGETTATAVLRKLKEMNILIPMGQAGKNLRWTGSGASIPGVGTGIRHYRFQLSALCDVSSLRKDNDDDEGGDDD
jgi:uncharacterized protein (DUF927 family)